MRTGMLRSIVVALAMWICCEAIAADKPQATTQPVDQQKATDASTESLAKQLSIDLGGGVSMELVLIRPGSFMMGSDKGGEKPVHKVTITKPLYVGKYEVTQEQWQAVMGANPSNFKGAKNPVEQISWDDCQSFTRKLQEKVPAQKFALPSEAQWEYACRAGSSSEYTYGDDASGLGEYGWYSSNSEQKTHPVGGKKPNAWGLYDMHGNVWEWCADAYGAYQDGDATDPTGSANGSARVLRGGAWNFSPVSCRAASRIDVGPGRRYNLVGVRVVSSAGSVD